MTPYPNPLEGMTQFLAQFRVPGLDPSTLSDARRKDVEALVEANRIALEGMQALARKQLEVFQATMSELQAMASPAADKGLSFDVTKQAQVAQDVWQRAVVDMRELAELAAKSQKDALTTIAQRATQNLQDMRRLAKP